MNEIKCPHCGEVFKVDASGYADIVKQVRDAEFSRDLDERVAAARREGDCPAGGGVSTRRSACRAEEHCGSETGARGCQARC